MARNSLFIYRPFLNHHSIFGLIYPLAGSYNVTLSIAEALFLHNCWLLSRIVRDHRRCQKGVRMESLPSLGL